MCARGYPIITIFILVISAAVATGCSARAAKQPRMVLTGRLVARVDGPRLTGFGQNHESYIFEMFSPGAPQFVRLSYKFLIYEPQVPKRTLDYSRLYKITAVRDDACDETLEKLSKTLAFNSGGDFVEIKYAITYAKNVPPLPLAWKLPMPCYLLSPQNLDFVTVP